jgi:hypothetical protein
MKRRWVMEDLNFKMDAQFCRAFKTTAAYLSLKNKELLERIFREWVARNGDPTIKSLLPMTPKQKATK